jgi:hypothetical protein
VKQRPLALLASRRYRDIGKLLDRPCDIDDAALRFKDKRRLRANEADPETTRHVLDDLQRASGAVERHSERLTRGQRRARTVVPPAD